MAEKEPGEYVTRHQAMHIAQEAGRQASIETLKLLGFDPHDPIETQKDAAWLRQARLGEAATKTAIKKAGITILASGIALALWKGFWAIRDAMKGF
ncbi:MAG: hypothetical protein VX464_11615 [Pseudomonadota bacterium]|nr:hypothetical protein [Pseudomonadota bacterium]